MRLIDRIPVLRTMFPAKAAAADCARRWFRAASSDPELIGDVIRLGRFFAKVPDVFEAGVPMGAPVDPIRLAVDRGRQEMAVELLSLMNITPTELQSLMEDDYDVS